MTGIGRRVMASLVVLGGFALTGCGGGYADTRDAYQNSREQHAAAAKRLRTDAGRVNVPDLGKPTTVTDDVCEARPADKFGGSHSVDCEAAHWLIYTGRADGTSDEAVWSAEKQALEALIQALDKAGWKRSGWNEQLRQALDDKTYNPYPVSHSSDKGPVKLQLYLVDRGQHRQNTTSGLYRQPDALQPTEPGTFTVAVHLQYRYLQGEPCDDCADKTPTSWPTRKPG